jgi:hypothetical protein
LVKVAFRLSNNWKNEPIMLGTVILGNGEVVGADVVVVGAGVSIL